MLATDHIATTKQFLENADREFDSGDVLQASEKLWGAACQVAIAEMHRRDIDPNGHRKIKRFVREFADEVRQPDLYSLFKNAETLHINFYHRFLSDENFLDYRALAREFVERMLELTE